MSQSSTATDHACTFSNPALQGMEYADVTQIAKGLEEKKFTSLELVDYLIIRIATFDTFEAVIEVNPDAQAIARALDDERAQGQLKGPLHGIPVLIKDNIHTGDRMQTSAGSPAMEGQPAAHDAFVVSRLREQGAILLGKANMDEWANFRGDALPPGWSGRGGQTLNPHNIEGDVCGSSSGSAVSVAAGFSPLSLGTDTFGSVVCPSALNGVVGLKPTVGLLSRSGVVPGCAELDSVGPIARTVYDAALLLNAMLGVDKQDPAMNSAPTAQDYTALLKSDALRGKRIGYSTLLDPTAKDEPLGEAFAAMTAAGAVMVPLFLKPLDARSLEDLFAMAIKRELPPYLASRNGLGVRSFDDLVAYNESSVAEGFNQDMLLRAKALTVDPQVYSQVWNALHLPATATLNALIEEHELDALVHDAGATFELAVTIANLALCPGITVPSGVQADRMPTALYFYGARWSEAKLLAIAYGYEQASMKRVSPVF